MYPSSRCEGHLTERSTDRARQNDHRVLLPGAVVFHILRAHRRAFLPAQSRVVRRLRAGVPRILRNRSPIRDQPPTEYRTVLRAPPCIRRNLVECIRLHLTHRRRHDIKFPYLHQDFVQRNLGEHGSEDCSRAIQGQRSPDSLPHDVPYGQPEGHAVRHQLLHFHWVGPHHRRHA